MKMTPIILFVYNRPWHTRQTIEALQHNDLAGQSILYLFADGPQANASRTDMDNISEVRRIVHSISGFKEVYIEENDTNKGLANSVIAGVDKVIRMHGSAIVVEDDIVAHPYFLRFMNEALSRYEKEDIVFGISATMEYFKIPRLYHKDVFLTYRVGSWGWATWLDRWQTIDWETGNGVALTTRHTEQVTKKKLLRGGNDLWGMLLAQQQGLIDSWAIRMQYHMALNDKLFLRPTLSLCLNIGMDGTGRHCSDETVPLLPYYNKDNYQIVLPQTIEENPIIYRRIKKRFGGGLADEVKYQLKKRLY